VFLESQALSSIAFKQPPSGTRLPILFIRAFPLNPLLISSHHIWDIVLSVFGFLLFYHYFLFFFSYGCTGCNASPGEHAAPLLQFLFQQTTRVNATPPPRVDRDGQQ
jgi:hypothetical protein